MGKEHGTSQRLETAMVFRFPEVNFDETSSRGTDGDLTANQLEWLVEKMVDTSEYDALRRAARSIRSFHELHIGAGTIRRVVPLQGEFGAASGIVTGLGLGKNKTLEIIHSSGHGIEGCTGKLTYGLLWQHRGTESMASIVTNLADLCPIFNPAA